MSTTFTQLDTSIENVDPPKKKRHRVQKKSVGKCIVKGDVAGHINVHEGSISTENLGEAESSGINSCQSSTKTNQQAKVNLCMIKTLKAEKEHLLKKVKQLSDDKNESEEKLQKELEFYKKYYQLDQYNRERGRHITKQVEQEGEEKREKELKGDEGLHNDGKKKQGTEFDDDNNIN